MDEVAYLMPQNVFIKNLSIDVANNTVGFDGMSVEISSPTDSLDAISKFMQSIQKSSYFQEATLSGTMKQTYEEKTAYAFHIDIKIKTKTEATEEKAATLVE